MAIEVPPKPKPAKADAACAASPSWFTKRMNSRLMPSSARDTTIVLITVPLAKATRKPLLRLCDAACAVRTLARTAMYMPM